MLVLFRIVKLESSSQYDADTVIDISQGNDSQPQQIPVSCEKYVNAQAVSSTEGVFL